MLETIFWLALVGFHFLGAVLALTAATPFVGLKRLSILLTFTTALLVVAIVGAALWTGHAWGVPLFLAPLLAMALLPPAAFAALRIAGRYSRTDALRGLAAVAVCAAVIGGCELIAVRLVTAAYVVPTNAMSPTIKGRHFLGVCEHCKSDVVVSAMPTADQQRFEPSDSGICSRCYRVKRAFKVRKELRIGDRILVNRLARPQRWDLAVFRYSLAPEQIWVKRLVGLPGEEIEIRDGSIFINGVKLVPPNDLAPLAWYEPGKAEETEFAPETFGIRGKSFHIDRGQYFMLGDNSPNSFDSRFWGPVPEQNLVGVVEATYFPPRSWKIFPRR
jgi:signal peptidase I